MGCYRRNRGTCGDPAALGTGSTAAVTVGRLQRIAMFFFHVESLAVSCKAKYKLYFPEYGHEKPDLSSLLKE